MQDLQEKYDLDLHLKPQMKPALTLNSKGKILNFLKLEQIGASSITKVKAMAKPEFKLSKF